MDILSARIKKNAESILENEALVEGLDESAAEILQEWGIKNATRVAEETDAPDEHSAEKAMYPQLRASRRLMRTIRVWVLYEKDSSPEEREKLWAKVEKRAKGLYDDEISLPAPDQFSGKTQAEFINNLLQWFGSDPASEVKGGKDKKTFFQSLLNR